MRDRLPDQDEKVRAAAVHALCDLAIFDLKSVQTDVLRKVAEHLEDKKVHAEYRYCCPSIVLCFLDESALLAS